MIDLDKEYKDLYEWLKLTFLYLKVYPTPYTTGVIQNKFDLSVTEKDMHEFKERVRSVFLRCELNVLERAFSLVKQAVKDTMSNTVAGKELLSEIPNIKNEIEAVQENGKAVRTKKSNIPKTFEELFSGKKDIAAINKTLNKLKAIDRSGTFILKKIEFVGFVDACIDGKALNLLPNHAFTPLCKLFAGHYKITISNGTIGEAKSSQPFYDFKEAFTKAYK